MVDDDESIQSTGSELFDVVVNHEEQYSIWPTGRELPGGWEAVGYQGAKEACLAHIAIVWTDMRPKSLRTWIETASNERTAD